MPEYGNGIGPGDHLEITVAAGLDRTDVATFPVTVTENGTVRLSELGQVDVRGLRPDSAGTVIERAFVDRELYVSPVVTVRVVKKHTNSVRVVGGVAKPGIYELPADRSDVLTAIVMAGDLSEDAGDKVEVRSQSGMPPGMEYAATSRGEIQQASHSQPMGVAGFMQPVTISLSALAQGGPMANPDGYKLDDGAVVVVQKLDPVPISVRGLVNKPGPLDPTGNDVRLMDALTQAGDVSNQFANKILVIRQTKSGDPITIKVKLTEAKRSNQSNILLAPGDIVSVEQTPATITMDALRVIRFGVSSRLNQLL